MRKLLALFILCGSVTGQAAVPSIIESSTTELSTTESSTTPLATVASNSESTDTVFPTGVPPTQSQAQTSTSTIKATNVDSVLSQVRKSFNLTNFEASFILVRGKFAEPYNWMHGIYQGQSIEYMRSQNGINIEIVRKDDLIGYFEAESKPHSVQSNTIEGVLPALFFDDSISLGDHYSIAIGGKSRVIDRAAQLIRIVAKDNYRYNYWLWLDIKSGLILKSALVSKQGEVLEQFQVTHLNILEQAPALAKKLSETALPAPIEAPGNSSVSSRWKINWLPQGFRVVSNNQHKLSMTGEYTDYILVSDGLVELSIFIQQPLSNKIKGGSLRSGSNVVAVHHGNGFDVSVIGKVPAITAERIAKSVTSG